MCPLGRYAFQRKEELSPGLRRLLSLVVSGERLNNYASEELRLLHLILCRTFDFCLNVLLLREAQVNTACRDESLLSRKVPIGYWVALYSTLIALGVDRDVLTKESSRAALAMRLNASPDLLRRVTVLILQRYDLRSCGRIAPNNLTDGNYLFNLGATLPSRCIMSLAACLHFWGDPCLEPWVRLFSGKFFLLYLLIGGFVGIRKTLLLDASERSYLGVFEGLLEDVAAIRGESRNAPRVAELSRCRACEAKAVETCQDEGIPAESMTEHSCGKISKFIKFLWTFNNGATWPRDVKSNRASSAGYTKATAVGRNPSTKK